MMILMTAALVAAQPAQPVDPHGQMAPMHHEQHDAMKKDCCKDCCKDMADKHEGHGGEHGHPAE
ncbi:MAG TPA: hypothetical protein VKC17_11610 [Sphingomicrobium sp.]|nr:hypothetical protein [Sphingomicrobium sp.]